MHFAVFYRAMGRDARLIKGLFLWVPDVIFPVLIIGGLAPMCPDGGYQLRLRVDFVGEPSGIDAYLLPDVAVTGAELRQMQRNGAVRRRLIRVGQSAAVEHFNAVQTGDSIQRGGQPPVIVAEGMGAETNAALCLDAVDKGLGTDAFPWIVLYAKGDNVALKRVELNSGKNRESAWAEYCRATSRRPMLS